MRVGYYVNNEYTDPEMVESPPAKVIFEKVRATPLHLGRAYTHNLLYIVHVQ